jgi:hypothetical protein
MKTQTTGQLWPLQSGSTNQPTLTPGAQTTYQFTDVPDRSPTGPLAYYLPGVRLTFRGKVVQVAEPGPSVVWSDLFFAALFSSLSWIQAWHGSPLQAQNILGTQWNVLEYFANGHRFESDVRGVIAPASAGTFPFEVTIFVPFSSCRLGDLEHDTSQLALLARASQLQINVAAASVLDGLSPGATITGFTATASAVLNPRQDLVLGTPVEPILTQIVAGAGNAVKITNFGVDTGLQGVDPGGGVLALNFLTAANNQGGSFDSINIQDFVWNWRGQGYTQDILGLLQAWKRTLPNKGPSFNVSVGGNTPAYDLYGVPYPLSNTSSYPASGAGAVNLEQLKLLFWALVAPGPDVQLSSLQTADSDQTFNMTIGAGGFFGTHQIQGLYARSWQSGMVQNWLNQVTAGGAGSLAAYVLGPNYANAKLARRGPGGKHVVTADESRYLPYQLFPAGTT